MGPSGSRTRQVGSRRPSREISTYHYSVLKNLLVLFQVPQLPNLAYHQPVSQFTMVPNLPEPMVGMAKQVTNTQLGSRSNPKMTIDYFKDKISSC